MFISLATYNRKDYDAHLGEGAMPFYWQSWSYRLDFTEHGLFGITNNGSSLRIDDGSIEDWTDEYVWRMGMMIAYGIFLQAERLQAKQGFGAYHALRCAVEINNGHKRRPTWEPHPLANGRRGFVRKNFQQSDMYAQVWISKDGYRLNIKIDPDYVEGQLQHKTEPFQILHGALCESTGGVLNNGWSWFEDNEVIIIGDFGIADNDQEYFLKPYESDDAQDDFSVQYYALPKLSGVCLTPAPAKRVGFPDQTLCKFTDDVPRATWINFEAPNVPLGEAGKYKSLQYNVTAGRIRGKGLAAFARVPSKEVRMYFDFKHRMNLAKAIDHAKHEEYVYALHFLDHAEQYGGDTEKTRALRQQWEQYEPNYRLRYDGQFTR